MLSTVKDVIARVTNLADSEDTSLDPERERYKAYLQAERDLYDSWNKEGANPEVFTSNDAPSPSVLGGSVGAILAGLESDDRIEVPSVTGQYRDRTYTLSFSIESFRSLRGLPGKTKMQMVTALRKKVRLLLAQRAGALPEVVKKAVAGERWEDVSATAYESIQLYLTTTMFTDLIDSKALLDEYQIRSEVWLEGKLTHLAKVLRFTPVLENVDEQLSPFEQRMFYRRFAVYGSEILGHLKGNEKFKKDCDLDVASDEWKLVLALALFMGHEFNFGSAFRHFQSKTFLQELRSSGVTLPPDFKQSQQDIAASLSTAAHKLASEISRAQARGTVDLSGLIAAGVTTYNKVLTGNQVEEKAVENATDEDPLFPQHGLPAPIESGREFVLLCLTSRNTFQSDRMIAERISEIVDLVPYEPQVPASAAFYQRYLTAQPVLDQDSAKARLSSMRQEARHLALRAKLGADSWCKENLSAFSLHLLLGGKQPQALADKLSSLEQTIQRLCRQQQESGVPAEQQLTKEALLGLLNDFMPFLDYEYPDIGKVDLIDRLIAFAKSRLNPHARYGHERFHRQLADKIGDDPALMQSVFPSDGEPTPQAMASKTLLADFYLFNIYSSKVIPEQPSVSDVSAINGEADHVYASMLLTRHGDQVESMLSETGALLAAHAKQVSDSGQRYRTIVASRVEQAAESTTDSVIKRKPFSSKGIVARHLDPENDEVYRLETYQNFFEFRKGAEATVKEERAKIDNAKESANLRDVLLAMFVILQCHHESLMSKMMCEWQVLAKEAKDASNPHYPQNGVKEREKAQEYSEKARAVVNLYLEELAKYMEQLAILLKSGDGVDTAGAQATLAAIRTAATDSRKKVKRNTAISVKRHTPIWIYLLYPLLIGLLIKYIHDNYMSSATAKKFSEGAEEVAAATDAAERAITRMTASVGA